MNAKQKYEAIIYEIEDGAKDPNRQASELMLDVANNSGLGARDLNAVMVFLTERTLRTYIKYRKMMAVYKYILETEKFDMITAVGISGYDNQSSFTKEFSRTFGMPPREAFKAKEASLYKEPTLWENISGDVVSQINIAKEIQPVKKETVFGIDPKQYAKAMEASELQELYSFDHAYSQVAFDVSAKWEIPLKDAFEYMESWRVFINEEYTEVGPLYRERLFSNDPEAAQEEPDFEEILRQEYAFHDTIKFLYFSVGLSVTLSIITMWRMVGIEDEITKIDPFILYEYAHTEDFDFLVFMADYQYFKDKLNEYEYKPEEFEELFDGYVNLLCGGMDKVEAFVIAVECSPPILDIEDLASFNLEFVMQEAEDIQMSSIEREAKEIERWNNNEPSIDIEYDPDNPDPYDDAYPWLLDDEDLKRKKQEISDLDEDDEDEDDEDKDDD